MTFKETQQQHQSILQLSDQDVENIKRFLPDKRYYEYSYHKLLDNPSAVFSEWKDWDEWTYPTQDLNRFRWIIVDNLDIIAGKTVVDFGCHLGYLSLFCLHNNAKFVTATNIRDHCLDIAKEVVALAGFESRFRAVIADLHDYAVNTELSKGVDTVLLSGVMYHVHDHYEILKSVTDSRPRSIIIDTLENVDIMNDPEPRINWKSEPANVDINGKFKDQETVEIGHPNFAWIRQAMESLGYRSKKYNVYQMFRYHNNFRSTQVYEYCEN